MSRAIRVVRPSAIVKASRAWQTTATCARAALREAGVGGDLRPLDDIASGRRGKSVPDGIVRLVRDLDAAGMGRESVGRLLHDSLRQMIDAAHDDVIDGPHAA